MAHPRSSIGWLLCACLACCIIHARHAHSASNFKPNDGPCKNLKSECLAWAEAGEVSEPQLVQRKATTLSTLSHSATQNRPRPPLWRRAPGAGSDGRGSPPAAVHGQRRFHVGQLLGGMLRCLRQGQP